MTVSVGKTEPNELNIPGYADMMHGPTNNHLKQAKLVRMPRRIFASVCSALVAPAGWVFSDPRQRQNFVSAMCLIYGLAPAEKEPASTAAEFTHRAVKPLKGEGEHAVGEDLLNDL